MSDEEIIKGLKCCKTANCSDCKGCPYKNKSDPTRLYVDCCNLLMIDALTLIDRQKTELQDLREIVFMDRSEAIKNLKAEAVKEFAERLKKDKIKPEFPWDDFTVTEGMIDELVKEFTEGKTDE